MMCSCDQLRKLVAQVRPVGRMSLEPCQHFFFLAKHKKQSRIISNSLEIKIIVK